jgi:2-dehydropantoate 2-reductase
MKALIYGGGSVGLGVASCLIKAGAEVDIIGRAPTVQALQGGGLLRTGIFGSYRATPAEFGSYSSLDRIAQAAYDYVLVSVKSFDSLGAAKDLSEHKRLLGPDTRIVLFQNGWGNADAFLSFFKPDQVYNARVITGFRRTKENEVEVTVHADSIHIGSLFGADLSRIETLCQFISEGDIPCEKTANVEKDLWAKMLYNCALNPLGALLDAPYGLLAESESTRMIMNSVIEEVFSVMAAAGYQTHWTDPSAFLEVFYKKLVPATAEHKSSTLQSVLAKKKTEIDALNGAVIKLADRHRVNVPYNQVLFYMVKFIEAANS